MTKNQVVVLLTIVLVLCLCSTTLAQRYRQDPLSHAKEVIDQSCGLASLIALCKICGFPIQDATIVQLAEEFGRDPDMTLDDMVAAGTLLGLQLEARAANWGEMKAWQRPCIIEHLTPAKEPHFSVFMDVVGGQVRYFNGGHELVIAPEGDLSALYGGYYLREADTATPATPALDVVASNIDVGLIEASDKEAKATFTLRNQSDAPVSLDLDGSGGNCTVEMAGDPVVPPGGQNDITLHYAQPDLGIGWMVLYTSDSARPFVLLSLQVRVHHELRLTPGTLAWTYRPGEDSRAWCTVTGSRDLEVTDVSVDSDQFQSKVAGSRTLGNGRHVFVCVTSLLAQPRKEATGTLTIRTNDPHTPVLSLALSAVVNGYIYWYPQFVFLDHHEESVELRVSSDDGQPFKVMAAESTIADVVCGEPIDNEDGTFTVAVELTAGAGEAAQHGVIVLTTDKPGEEKLGVPVYTASGPKAAKP